MAKVVVMTIDGEKEPVDSMLRRFKKMVIKDEILVECRKREHFMSNREKRKFKQDMAIKRLKNKKYR